jgi:hypothetical protein
MYFFSSFFAKIVGREAAIEQQRANRNLFWWWNFIALRLHSAPLGTRVRHHSKKFQDQARSEIENAGVLLFSFGLSVVERLFETTMRSTGSHNFPS